MAENPEMMAIAIEFRLKGRTLNNEGGEGDQNRKSYSESKAYKQLKQDCAALQSEHPDKICFTLDTQVVAEASNLIFRQYNVVDAGHQIQ